MRMLEGLARLCLRKERTLFYALLSRCRKRLGNERCRGVTFRNRVG